MKNFLFLSMMAFAVPALASSSSTTMSVLVQGDPIRPDPKLTPGAFNVPPTPLAILCQTGHTMQTRHVTNGLKARVFREYGYDPKTITRGNYEIDHDISLEIDGTNDIKNLWPESYITQPLNAHRKDVLEATLHRMVCKGTLPLAVAQQAIATDWVVAYNEYVLKQAASHE